MTITQPSTHLRGAARAVPRDVAVRWSEPLNRLVPGFEAGSIRARNRVARRKRDAVLTPEQFIEASLALMIEKRLAGR
jgi:hypothetical protein